MGVGMSIPFPFLFPFAQAALAQAALVQTAGLPKLDLLELHTSIPTVLPAVDCDTDISRLSTKVDGPADIMQDNNMSLEYLREALTDDDNGGGESVSDRFVTIVDILKSKDTHNFTAADNSK
jgi:hypothetical protein